MGVAKKVAEYCRSKRAIDRRPERLAEARHLVEAHQLALAVAQVDLRQIRLLLELAVLRLDAHVVALAVARIVVVLGDIDAAGQHADRQRDVGRVEVEAGGAHPVGLEHQLRQVELQVGVHAADLRVGLQRALQLGGDAAHLLQIRAP